ncbi:hypothetical protein M422DRAFT_238816 [Sphaerobolus stellatus SS14]|nr:hypothetical protein M422DRAFT_238816 [Sphaerobolus stellatus SS14]
MFSRIFGSSKTSTEAKRTEDSTVNASVSPAAVGGRVSSPTVTESASIAASAPPESPSRLGIRTPSPIPLVEGQDVDTEALPSPSELRALSLFLAALTPPPRLHCVRCHKWYYEVENDDRSCTMAHDDDSAEVEHVGYGNKRGGAYETRWDCCGKTVEGSGDLGPPSGWCYEGKHTVDPKRARYRNDSTPTNDLLQSCERRGCHRKREAARPRSVRNVIPDDARSVRSTRSTETNSAPKKRGRKRKNPGTVRRADTEKEKAKDGDDFTVKKKKLELTAFNINRRLPVSYRFTRSDFLDSES